MTTNWIYFTGCVSVTLICSFFMDRCGRHFYSYNKTIHKFSILDLQFPATTKSLNDLFEGIETLSGVSKKIFSALKLQLIIDFFFMPGAYLSIMFLCLKTSSKSGPVGEVFFCALAYLQFAAWFCDIVENIYLLNKISVRGEMSEWFFKVYRILEFIKWGISSYALFCSLSALLYFWVKGNFNIKDIVYLFIVMFEISIFIIANKVFNKPVFIVKEHGKRLVSSFAFKNFKKG